MTDLPKITLRYFNARGRGQFLRYYLLHRNVPFEDERVPLSAGFSEWQAIRPDRKVAGPFHKLPVLHWGDRMIAETMVIHAFLHEALGDRAKLSEDDRLREAMLASSAYNDVVIPVAMLIWADIMFKGLDLPTFAKGALQRVQNNLTSLDETVREWNWFARSRERPVMVLDCLLWEAIDFAMRAFGARLNLDNAAALTRFYAECPGRVTFERLLREHPCQLTGRPGEAQALDGIERALAA
jgi:hypothetical protein